MKGDKKMKEKEQDCKRVMNGVMMHHHEDAFESGSVSPLKTLLFKRKKTTSS